MPIQSLNPATGRLIRTFEEDSDIQLDQKLELSARTFESFSRTSVGQRARWMNAAADILESEKREIGALMTLEMGKTITSAAEEAAKCAWACRYYAEHGERFLADEIVGTTATRSFISYKPIGPVLAVMPWNFPFWQVFRFAAPALMAGNTGLLKHASSVPQCALRIEEIFQRAGFPPGVFQSLMVGSKRIAKVIEDSRVKAVTLTGSEDAGRSVAALAGKLIKKTVLELGGSDPFIVMPGARIADAAAVAVRARCINNGQSCIAAKRFIIHKTVYDEFERQFVGGMNSLIVGDPMDEKTEVGPVASEELLNQLEAQVNRSVAMGARVLTGGKRLDRPGSFFAPTVLASIPKDSPAAREEIFGPVATLFQVGSIDEAITLANDTPFGLGSSAWTNDTTEQQRFIDELQSGMVFINAMVASDPRLPFGGVKNSGYGRELGVYGMREFVNVKSIWVK